MKNAYLVFFAPESGELRCFDGYFKTDPREVISAVSFCSEEISYTDVLSDPSNGGKGVVFAYPLIGNAGLTAEEFEKNPPRAAFAIAREFTDEPSNFACAHTIGEYFEKYALTAVCGADTRGIVKFLSDKKRTLCLITDKKPEEKEALEKLRSYKATPFIQNVVPGVYENSLPTKLAVIDLGCGERYAGALSHRASVRIFAPEAPIEEIKAFGADRIFISDGSEEDPVTEEILSCVKSAVTSSIPVMAVGLGHILCARAMGAGIFEMKLGHHGSNCPVGSPGKAGSGRVYITNQNHSLAVDPETLSKLKFEVTQINRNDGTVEAIAYKEYPVKTFAYRPDFSDDGQGTGFVYDEFLK